MLARCSEDDNGGGQGATITEASCVVIGLKDACSSIFRWGMMATSDSFRDAPPAPTSQSSDRHAEVLASPRRMLLLHYDACRQIALELVSQLDIEEHLCVDLNQLYQLESLKSFEVAQCDFIFFDITRCPTDEWRSAIGWLRSATLAPIVILLRVGDANQKVVALKAGADVALSLLELPLIGAAHCRAVWRRYTRRWKKSAFLEAVSFQEGM